MTGLQLLHRLLQLLQGLPPMPWSPVDPPALLGLPLLLLVPAGLPMHAVQYLPPQPAHCPPDALAAPQPSQQGGLFHFLAYTGDLGLLPVLLEAAAAGKSAQTSPASCRLSCAAAVESKVGRQSLNVVGSPDEDIVGEGG